MSDCCNSGRVACAMPGALPAAPTMSTITVAMSLDRIQIPLFTMTSLYFVGGDARWSIAVAALLGAHVRRRLRFFGRRRFPLIGANVDSTTLRPRVAVNI